MQPELSIAESLALLLDAGPHTSPQASAGGYAKTTPNEDYAGSPWHGTLRRFG